MNTDTMRFHTSRSYPLQENSNKNQQAQKVLKIYPPIYCNGLNLVPCTPPIIKPNINPSYMPFTHYQLVKHIHPQAPCKKNSTKECSLCIQIEAYHPTCQDSCPSADGRSSSQESAHCLHPLQLLSPPPVDLETPVVKDPQAAT